MMILLLLLITLCLIMNSDTENPTDRYRWDFFLLMFDGVSKINARYELDTVCFRTMYYLTVRCAICSLVDLCYTECSKISDNYFLMVLKRVRHFIKQCIHHCVDIIAFHCWIFALNTLNKVFTANYIHTDTPLLSLPAIPIGSFIIIPSGYDFSLVFVFPIIFIISSPERVSLSSNSAAIASTRL